MARIKEVFRSQHDTVKAYLAGKHPRGRCGGNIFFEGDTIYSFGQHFPVALKVSRLGKVALFTIDRYSSTTSQHMSMIGSYLSNDGFEIFHVAHLDDQPSRHRDNVADYATRIAELIGRAQRARRRRESLVSDAQEMIQEANRYAETFGVNVRVLFPELPPTERLAHALSGSFPIKALGKVEAKQLVKEVA